MTFIPDEITVTVQGGTDLLTAAAKAGIAVHSTCGGEGTCGRCRVRVVKGNTTNSIKNYGNLPRELRNAGFVLACQTYVEDNLVIEIPAESRIDEHQVLLAKTSSGLLGESKLDLTKDYMLNPICHKYRLELEPPTLNENTSDLERLQAQLQKKYKISNITIDLNELRKLATNLRAGGWKVTVTIVNCGDQNEIIKVEPGFSKKPCYGLAVDLGTTTVAVSLVDTEKGCSIDRVGAYNKQARYGDDVIARIIYANEHGVKELQSSVIGTTNELISKILKRNEIATQDIAVMTTAGNTTMAHLFLGMDPKYIRLEPYTPTASKLPIVRAGQLGLNINYNVPVYSFPAVASYVGGDIVAGSLAVGISNTEDLTLLIDIGTNGEIVFGNREWLISCACSAGPAFEGGGISCGTRAMKGAIERLEIEPDTLQVNVSIIGGGKAIGICGSGLIDCISEMHKAGIIDRSGQFIKLAPPVIKQTDSDKELILVTRDKSALAKDIVITENDVKNLIRSKGAVFAGVQSLLKTMQIELEMVEQVLIAGGFGNYLNVPEAIQIGLLPDLPLEKFEFVGNTSLKGAELALLSQEALEKAEDIRKMMTYLELSAGNLFMDEFMSALFLPHTDLSLFPSLAK